MKTTKKYELSALSKLLEYEFELKTSFYDASLGCDFGVLRQRWAEHSKADSWPGDEESYFDRQNEIIEQMRDIKLANRCSYPMFRCCIYSHLRQYLTITNNQ